MTDISLTTTMEPSFDGEYLAIHRAGRGRPVLLLHGLFSNANTNWIRFGHAAALAEAGFEAIMPDLRGHGDSTASHDPRAYPQGVLVRDLETVARRLGLVDYDLCGFSLGARTAICAVMSGLSPRRLAICGMGLEGLSNWEERARFFIDAIDRFDEVKAGDPAYFAVQFLKTTKTDRGAMRRLLEAVESLEVSDLNKLAMPAAVICGDKDRDNGSPQALADILPDGQFIEIPGTHMSCVTKPELGQAITGFLSAG